VTFKSANKGHLRVSAGADVCVPSEACLGAHLSVWRPELVSSALPSALAPLGPMLFAVRLQPRAHV